MQEIPARALAFYTPSGINSRMRRLGELLTDSGLITEAQLDKALDIQTRDKTLIGRIMVTENYIRMQKLQRLIADNLQLPFVELNVMEPDSTLIDKSKRDEYFELELIPLSGEGNKITLAVTNLDERIKAWSAGNYENHEVSYAITSPFDILLALQKAFAENDDHAARFDLHKKTPEYSAQQLFSLPAKIILIGLLVAFEASLYFVPETAFTYFGIFVNIFCLATISYKSAIFAMGNEKQLKADYMPDIRLPVYTVLVPLYKEEKSIRRLLNSLEKLDYPRSKLDIKLVVENDDVGTIEALKRAAPPQYMEIIRVPFSLPRTKPKACNYALRYARGEFITIFDAEDDPDPMQLKKSLATFAHGGEKLACTQARLNYYNAERNLLTRWFSLEYATWFEFVMPGLENIKSPIPLGGTSNHVRTSVLKEIGGWDAFNVTEDADLGMRLSQHGYTSATIDSITMEEAPVRIMPWLKQRTRWMKGFMQTYLVHMRDVKKLVKQTGWQGFATLQFFIGFPFVIYLMMPFWFVSASIIEMPKYLEAFALFNFIYGVLTHMIMGYVAERRVRSHTGKKLFSTSPVYPVVTLPLYGVFHIIASYMALYQLIFKPHYWNKTEHGE